MEQNLNTLNLNNNTHEEVELAITPIMEDKTVTEESDSYTLLFIIISTIVIFLIYKLFFSKGKKKLAKDTILIIGPASSGKTAFFYTLIGSPNKDTVTSMDFNLIENQTIAALEDKGRLDLLDIPGQGFFKTKIVDTLSNAKAIIVFLDSSDKESISRAAEYIYDILNNEQFDEMTPLIVACNKQDLKFPKSKKIIESDLNNEIENIKQIKQKNNLEETSQMGALFSMRIKFNFTMFKNVQFVETDKPSGFESVIKMMKELI